MSRDISGALGMPSNKNYKDRFKIGIANDIDNREPNDFYATDPRAIDALFEVEDFDTNIWEPAAGQGHLSNRMKHFGKNVYSSDLIDRGRGYVKKDFLNSDVRWVGDIITNPPFKYGIEFVNKALQSIEEGAKVAFFVKLLFLETQKRRELFELHPPKVVHVFSKRIGTFKGGGTDYSGNTAIAYCWIVWEKGYKGETKLSWI